VTNVLGTLKKINLWLTYCLMPPRKIKHILRQKRNWSHSKAGVWASN